MAVIQESSPVLVSSNGSSWEYSGPGQWDDAGSPRYQPTSFETYDVMDVGSGVALVMRAAEDGIRVYYSSDGNNWTRTAYEYIGTGQEGGFGDGYRGCFVHGGRFYLLFEGYDRKEFWHHSVAESQIVNGTWTRTQVTLAQIGGLHATASDVIIISGVIAVGSQVVIYGSFRAASSSARYAFLTTTNLTSFTKSSLSRSNEAGHGAHRVFHNGSRYLAWGNFRMSGINPATGLNDTSLNSSLCWSSNGTSWEHTIRYSGTDVQLYTAGSAALAGVHDGGFYIHGTTDLGAFDYTANGVQITDQWAFEWDVDYHQGATQIASNGSVVVGVGYPTQPIITPGNINSYANWARGSVQRSTDPKVSWTVIHTPIDMLPENGFNDVYWSDNVNKFLAWGDHSIEYPRGIPGLRAVWAEVWPEKSLALDGHMALFACQHPTDWFIEDGTEEWDDNGYDWHWVVPGVVRGEEITYGIPHNLHTDEELDAGWGSNTYEAGHGNVSFIDMNHFVATTSYMYGRRRIILGRINMDLSISILTSEVYAYWNGSYDNEPSQTGPSSLAHGEHHVTMVSSTVGITAATILRSNSSGTDLLYVDGPDARAFRVDIENEAITLGPISTIPLPYPGYEIYPATSSVHDLFKIDENKAIYGGSFETNFAQYHSIGPVVSDPDDRKFTNHLITIMVNPNTLDITFGPLDSTRNNARYARLDTNKLFCITMYDYVFEAWDDNSISWQDDSVWTKGEIIQVNLDNTFTTLYKDKITIRGHDLAVFGPDCVAVMEGGRLWEGYAWTGLYDEWYDVPGFSAKIVDIDPSFNTFSTRLQNVYFEGTTMRSSTSRPGRPLGDGVHVLIPSTGSGKPFVLTKPLEISAMTVESRGGRLISKGKNGRG